MTAAAVSLGALALLVALALALPLVGKPRAHSRRQRELAVHKDRLAEIGRDLERGLLKPEQARAARLEIERRILKTARRPEELPVRRRGGRLLAAAAVVLTPLLAVLLYAQLGSPTLPDLPLAARDVQAERGRLAQIEQMVTELEARLAADPADAEGWLMLGRSRLVLGDPPAAADAYRKAAALQPDRPEVLQGLAEALVATAGGIVTPEARALFESVAAKAPQEPRTAYYLGLAEAQAGEAEAAIERWRRLLAASPSDASWRPQIEAAIRTAAREAGGIDAEAVIAGAPGLAPQAPAGGSEVAGLPPAGQAEAIRGMVEGLEARLRDEGGTPEEWQRLGRARQVLGERDAARDAFAKAHELAPDDPGTIIAYAEALTGPNDPRTRLPQVGEDAADLFARAAELQPEAPLPQWFLGIRALQTGSLEGARAHWAKLLTLLGPEHPDYAGIKALLDAMGGNGRGGTAGG